MRRIRISKRVLRSPRRNLRLHATFVAPGDSSSADIASYIEFQEILLEARALRSKHRRRELRVRERSLKWRAALIPKVAEILRRHFGDKITAKEAANKIRRICPDKQRLRELFDFFSKTPPTPTLTSEEVAAEKADITRRERELRAWIQISRHLDVLSNRAQSGESDAIERLAEIGRNVVFSMMLAERMHPEAVRKVARSQMLWPFLASAKAGWEDSMFDKIQKLELGKHLEVLHTPFHPARGPDVNYPARRWAKAAVRTIEETRLRHLLLREVKTEAEEIVLGGLVGYAKSPEWSRKACDLPMFSKDTVPEWGVIVREMIREQAPNFHARPEWENQRNTAAHSARNTVGEIRNAILDDITSALKRVAPKCRNSCAEIKQVKKEKPSRKNKVCCSI